MLIVVSPNGTLPTKLSQLVSWHPLRCQSSHFNGEGLNTLPKSVGSNINTLCFLAIFTSITLDLASRLLDFEVRPLLRTLQQDSPDTDLIPAEDERSKISQAVAGALNVSNVSNSMVLFTEYPHVGF